jgi:hypothetical protein
VSIVQVVVIAVRVIRVGSVGFAFLQIGEAVAVEVARYQAQDLRLHDLTIDVELADVDGVHHRPATQFVLCHGHIDRGGRCARKRRVGDHHHGVVRAPSGQVTIVVQPVAHRFPLHGRHRSVAAWIGRHVDAIGIVGVGMCVPAEMLVDVWHPALIRSAGRL